MGKKSRNNRNKRRDGYFDKEIQQNGEDFLRYKTPIDIQNAAQRIFRDIARGNIDPIKHSKYFLDKGFNINLTNYAVQKFNYHNISYMALSHYYTTLLYSGTPIDDLFISVMNDHKMKLEAYTLISSTLNSIITSGDGYSPLVYLMSELSKYRRVL